MCCNRYSANWSAQLIDVEGFALFNCGEISSQISPCDGSDDGSGDISPKESSNALNLFCVFTGLLLLLKVVHSCVSDKLCDWFWK